MPIRNLHIYSWKKNSTIIKMNFIFHKKMRIFQNLPVLILLCADFTCCNMNIIKANITFSPWVGSHHPSQCPCRDWKAAHMGEHNLALGHGNIPCCISSNSMLASYICKTNHYQGEKNFRFL